jgi:hypothetical protein
LLCLATALTGCPDGGGGLLSGSNAPAEGEGGFTILLHTFSGSEHVPTAKYYKEQAGKHTSWRGLYVVHKADHSALYWGKYRTIEGAQRNLKIAKMYKTKVGAQPFVRAIVMPLPGKSPGRPEWDLKTVTGTYTVLVGVFYNVPGGNLHEWKQYAADYCEELRNKGEQAYYKHDPSQSIVTIGVFGPEAIGHEGTGAARKPVIRNPRMAEIRKRYPHAAVNGYKEIVQGVNPTTGEPEKRARESYVIRIPKEGETVGTDRLNRTGQWQHR